MSYDWSGQATQIHTVTQALRIAQDAEQRLAAANALLREARDWLLADLDYDDRRPLQCAARIDAHLKDCA